MTILGLQGVSLRFGGLTAIQHVSLTVKAGEIVSIIGPNGAGKTSLFNVITGVYQPTSGSVTFNDRPTMRTLDSLTIGMTFLVAFLTGLGLLMLVNISGLWDAVINQRYVYQSPFAWSQAFLSVKEYFSQQSFSYTFLPLMVGICIGGLGASLTWYRTRRTADYVTDLGIARTFQNIRLFSGMSVLENLLVGMERRFRTSFWSAALRLPAARRELQNAIDEAMELLRFVELEEYAHARPTSLPYGSQRRLEIARALASQPALLLLDEPAAGMNHTESQELMNLICKIRERGLSVLLIEHHMKVVMGISDRIIVLHYGNKIAEGNPDEIKSNPLVIEAYLGHGDHAL